MTRSDRCAASPTAPAATRPVPDQITPALYVTRIRHIRTEPIRRDFRYRSYSWFVDVDDLPRLPGPLASLAGFHGADHFDGAPGEDLRTRVDRVLADHDIDLRGGRVTALLNARVLGYVFNPLSVFWCHAPEGSLVCVIAEVHNTFGQRHSYLVRTDERGRAQVDKQFYVSPFNGLGGHYTITLPEPGARLHLQVGLHRDGHAPFTAVVTGRRRPVTASTVAAAHLQAPLAPWAVAARIRIEGIGLWLRGLPIRPRPAHPRHLGTDSRSGRMHAAPAPAGAPRAPSAPSLPTGLRARLGAPVVAALLRRAAEMVTASGHPLRIVAADGAHWAGSADPAAPTMIVDDLVGLTRRVAAAGLVGFGESYTARDWSADDLAAVLTTLAADLPQLVPAPLQRLRRLTMPRPPAQADNTAANARVNIAHHYDLPPEMFELFLDETMTYSSALFDHELTGTPARMRAAEPTSAPQWAQLRDAQHRKIDRLLDRLGVGVGTRLLEIGTGWGELCVRAAARGAQVHSVTLSARQQEVARARVAAAGLTDAVRIDLQDYRQVTGRYDAIVAVEMIEAVGHRYWPAYFQTLDRLLAPGGRVGIQAITMPHDRMLATRDTHTWIQKYIFPGGFLPSTRAIAQTAATHTGLRVTERLDFGMHYAHTLRLWADRADARSADFAEHGFDADFHRLWRFYLRYSQAGFAAGYLDVHHFLLTRPGGAAALPGVDR